MSAPAAAPPVPLTGRVLVVDDEWKNRMLLQDLLEVQGHEVFEAENGEAALQVVEEHPPDVVLLDVMMPRMDGFEVCRRLKGSPKTASIPVLLVTSLTDRKDRLTGIEAGANDFLTKPIDTQDVILRVRNAVQSKKLFDQLDDNYRQLQELERLRDSLTHMVVHDLRTPLTSLLTGMQTLEYLGPLNPEQEEFVGIAVQGGQTLLGMINDLLDISKMEDGSLQLDRAEVDARPLMDRVRRQVEHLAEERGLAVRSEVASGLGPAYADEEKLLRTLVNLTGNAVKFTPPGGTITLSASRTADAVLFGVTDTGEGIPKEAFGKIFEKFGQVESRKAGRKMSTGLGLTFCKIAAEAHGGRIWVESELGAGSTFWFTIPDRA